MNVRASWRAGRSKGKAGTRPTNLSLSAALVDEANVLMTGA
jgi:hypothetical protein